MPIYDFECSNCGNKKEAIVSSDEIILCCQQPMIKLFPNKTNVRFAEGFLSDIHAIERGEQGLPYKGQHYETYDD